MPSGSEVEIKLVETPIEIAGAIEVRRRVFVEEQHVPVAEEYDEHDTQAIHAVAVCDGAIVATGRVYQDEEGNARIGRMAVDVAWRRKGVGGGILTLLEETAVQRGLTRAVLHAQTYVESFYRRYGYTPEGQPFQEAGIEHIAMSKRLS